MKALLLPLAALLLFLGSTAVAPAQALAPGTAPDGTVVTSETFRFDLAQHQGVFTGSVVVVSKGLTLKSREMTVYFAQGGGNKVERLIARGEVLIDTGDRTAKAEQAEYTVADDKMVLTGSPQILQGKDVITGATITLYRGSNRLEVDGRSRMVLTGDLTPPKTP